MKVSIVVPMYNVSNYLKRCLESILNQTYQNIEVIAIDDGSTDDTLKIANEFEKKDSRLRVLSQENKGLSEARNVGIENSNGEYIFFVDSDDWLENEIIEKLVDYSNNNNLDIACCGINQFTSTQVIKKGVNSNLILSGEEAVSSYFQSKFNMEPMVWNKLYKSRIFDILKFEKGKLHEDKFFTPKALFLSNYVGFIPYLGYNYEMEREGSITNKKLTIRNLDGLEANLNNSEYFERNSSFKFSRMSLRKYYLDLMLYYCLYEKSQDHEISSELVKKFNENFIRIIGLSILYDNPQRFIKTVLFRINPKVYFEKWSKSKNEKNQDNID